MAWTIRFKKRALILYHANLSSKPQHVQHKVQLNYYLSKMCISWSYTKNYGKHKRFYMCKEGDLGLIHTGLETSRWPLSSHWYLGRNLYFLTGYW